MCTASKSPRKVAAVALAVGRRTLPKYGHRFSRHDFTLAQHFACLVLRQFFRTDYRGIVAILDDCPRLREALRLRGKTPHFTTLQKAEKRLLRDEEIKRLLTQTVAMFHARGSPRRAAPPETHVVETAAADSTGFALDRASRYFITRRARAPNVWQTTTYRRFAKLPSSSTAPTTSFSPRIAAWGRGRMWMSFARCWRACAPTPRRNGCSPTPGTTSGTIIGCCARNTASNRSSPRRSAGPRPRCRRIVGAG